MTLPLFFVVFQLENGTYRVNDLNDLEIVYPVESIFKNYYHFPDNKNIVISKSGIVRDINTGNVIFGNRHDSGKTYYSATDNITRIKTVYQLHRILAITFIGRPSRHLDKSLQQLEVNHVNGRRIDHSLDNLEWVTGKENVLHAHRSGLYKTDSPVQTMNVITGKLESFTSAKHCADVYDIHRATFHKHLNSKNCSKAKRRNTIFRYYSDTEWIVDLNDAVTYPEFGKNGLMQTYIVTFNDCVKSIIVDGINKAAELGNVPLTTCWRHVKRFGFCDYGNVRIKPLIK